MAIFDSRETRRRLPLLFAIAAVHLAMIATMGPLSPRTSVAAQPTPIEVTFADDSRASPPEALQISAPLMAMTSMPTMEPPSIDLAEEPLRPSAITVLPAHGSPHVVASHTLSIDEVSYVRAPRPRYPPESRRLAEQGLVLLLVTIDEAGRAARVEIQTSSGHPRLDAAARDAVEHALFKPYVENGIARAVLATIPIEFNWKRRGERG